MLGQDGAEELLLQGFADVSPRQDNLETNNCPQRRDLEAVAKRCFL